MVARTKMARARLTPQEYEQLERDAEDSGVSVSEYVRGLIIGHRSELATLGRRLENLTRRVELVEDALATAAYGRIQ